MSNERIIVSWDPATGASSLPGYAVWLVSGGQAELVAAATVKVAGKSHWERMRTLSLRVPVIMADLLDEKALQHLSMVVEGLPPTFNLGGKSGFANSSSVHLHHSVAVIATALPWREVEELQVATWKAFLRHVGRDAEYVKSDLHDAIVIGMAWLWKYRFPVPILQPNSWMALFPKHGAIGAEEWTASMKGTTHGKGHTNKNKHKHR